MASVTIHIHDDPKKDEPRIEVAIAQPGGDHPRWKFATIEWGGVSIHASGDNTPRQLRRLAAHALRAADEMEEPIEDPRAAEAEQEERAREEARQLEALANDIPF